MSNIDVSSERLMKVEQQRAALEQLAHSLVDVYGKDGARDMVCIRAVQAVESIAQRALALAEVALEMVSRKAV